MSSRLNQEREKELAPVRMKFAITEIEKLGYAIEFRDKTKIQFTFNGSMITMFTYSGWFSGKSVTAGRGIINLLKQISK